MNNVFFNRTTLNIIVLALLSLVEALQILIAVVFIFSFIPIPIPPLVYKFYPLTQYTVHLKRDSSFYHLWIIVGLGLQGLLLFFNRQRLQEDLGRKLLPYIATMAGFVVLQIFAVFKILLWGNPCWSRLLFDIALGTSLLCRIFWPEVHRSMAKVWAKANTVEISRWGKILFEATALLVLYVLIFRPDLNEVLARMFSYDKFYHLDSFIMSGAWAHHQNLILNKDVTSEYSLMIPVVFDKLMTLSGGFDYAHAVQWMIGLSAIYYLLLFGLWRYWTKSFLLSLLATILVIKLQFFHWGVLPLIWIYPSATALRFLPDVFFLFFILRFTQDLKLRWLTAAAFVGGLGLAWTTDVGSYMVAVLVMAAVASIYLKGLKIIPRALAIVLVPWIVGIATLSIVYGALIWGKSFWENTFEFASLFLQGWGALPITEGLKDQQFFAFSMGLTIPVVYLGTLLYSLGMFVFRRSQAYLFIGLISVYGLGLYHYFIHRSGVTSYDVVIVPLIFVLLFWLKFLLGLFKKQWQNGIKLFLCAWALLAMMTSYLFTYYPNIINLSGFDWGPEKKFYAQQFDFSQDASLIDALTSPQEPVVLISSFETKILMQANRRPFFYYFPMMESEHMRGDKLRGIYLHTYARLERTLQQMQDLKPAHIFIQTRLFEGPEARGYEDSHEGFKQLMAYIRSHYQYQDRGQYLTALKWI